MVGLSVLREETRRKFDLVSTGRGVMTLEDPVKQAQSSMDEVQILNVMDV